MFRFCSSEPDTPAPIIQTLTQAEVEELSGGNESGQSTSFPQELCACGLTFCDPGQEIVGAYFHNKRLITSWRLWVPENWKGMFQVDR